MTKRKPKPTGRQLYKKALHSKHWAEIKKKAHERAHDTCEHEGCDVVGGLHCHHLTYDRLGKERLSDVRMLCPDHHAVAELMKLQCRSCMLSTFLNEEEAWNHWMQFAPVKATRWRFQLDKARTGTPALCTRCRS